MKLVSFESAGKTGIGCVDDGGAVHDISGVPGMASDLVSLIARGDELLPKIEAAFGQGDLPVVEESRLLAPIPNPMRNIFCVGKNYHAHAEEFHKSGFDSTGGDTAIPEVPIIFTKATTSVIGPEDSIPASSDATNSVDYEGEFTVVIGKGGHRIPKDRAYDHVFGYLIVNDVTSRVIQKRHGQWVLGKSMDGFCPMGPWLVTADEVGEIGHLRLATRVNGELRQEASLQDLIFDVPTLIATISDCISLLPGDLIATGTPPGVGIGFSPPKFLKPGDEVTVTIDKLGSLHNPVH